MAEITTFGAKMTEEQKEDLQKRIAASGMTAAEYLQTIVRSFEAQQSKETMLDDVDIKALDYHMARVSEIYLSMAKSRADERHIAQETQANLEEQIKGLKAELFDLKCSAEEQLKALRASTDGEIEAAEQRASNAEQRESQAIDDKIKAEANELLAKRSLANLEEYNADLKAQIADAKQQIIIADNKATEAHEKVKELQDILSNEQAKNSTLQAQNEVLTIDLQRISQELTEVKRSNESLLSQLETERELKNQAIGELKAIYTAHKEAQETIEQQRGTIDELRLELWKLSSQEQKQGE